MKRVCLLWVFLALSMVARAEEVDRGGSFCITPALFLPAGNLSNFYHPGMAWNLDFDVGVSPAWSVIFGSAYTDLEARANPESRLVLVPAWFGMKSKAQFKPSVELYWSMAGELIYEKAYVRGKSGTGSIENLDGGAVLGAGFDLWLKKWLLTGVETKAHLIYEGGQIYPIMELGLRIGIRG